MLVIHNKIRLVTIPKYWFLIPSLTTLDKMPYHFVVNARIRIGAIKWFGMYVCTYLVSSTKVSEPNTFQRSLDVSTPSNLHCIE